MKFTRIVILSALTLVAACGDSNNSFNGAEPVSDASAITSANATVAAQVSWEAVVASSEFGSLGGSVGLSASTPGTFSKASGAPEASGFLINVLQKVPFGPDVFPCLVSGIVTISGDIEDPLTLTPDDTFRAVSELCDDGAGEVVDGTIDLTVTEFGGDVLLGTYRLAMDAVVTDLQVATGTETITNNGDASLTLDTTGAPFVEVGVSGTSMTVDSNTSSETLTNYSSNQTVDGGLQTLPYTLSAAGTLDTTQLAGTLRYSTPLTFAGEGLDFPGSGQLLVVGNNSSLRLIAVDNVNVTIEIDTNGDGTIDATIETTWAAITSS